MHKTLVVDFPKGRGREGGIKEFCYMAIFPTDWSSVHSSGSAPKGR